MPNAVVLLVDDHPLFREGFSAMTSALRPEWTIDLAVDCAEALAKMTAREPDLVVVDVRLPDGDGFALVRAICSRRPEVSCVMISGREDQAASVLARSSGARAFVSKSSPPEDLVAVLDRAIGGQSYFVTEAHQSDLILSVRQAEVLTLLSEGHSNKEIRHRLGIAERTVRSHLTELFGLLGADSRIQALIRARELGLIE